MTIAALLRRSGRLVLDALLPPRCLVCDTPTDRHDGLCPACWSEMAFITPPYCAVFGTPFTHDLGEGAVSARALTEPPVFRRARAPLLYAGPARDLVMGLKFGRRRELAIPMARLMSGPAASLVGPDSLVMPVPLHAFRRWQRRFNQSADLARHLCRSVGGTFDPHSLRRVRPTRRQVGLEAKARLKNVRNAFEVVEHRLAAVHGRPVVLVDDVLTTGATVSACAKTLLQAGAVQVDVLTFAIALPGQQDSGADL